MELTKDGRYDTITVPVPYGSGQKGICYIKAVSPFPREVYSGGGGADVEKADFGVAAVFDFLCSDGLPAHHKSVLTARLAPKRST